MFASSVTAKPCHRLACGLGQVAALTVHRTVIHYRTPASLPNGGRLIMKERR